MNEETAWLIFFITVLIKIAWNSIDNLIKFVENITAAMQKATDRILLLQKEVNEIKAEIEALKGGEK